MSSNEMFLPGIPTVDDFSRSSLKTIANAIATSNVLPSAKNEDWAFYSTFPAFRKVMSAEKISIQSLLDQLLKWNGIKGRCPSAVADMMDLLAEANDQLLERVNANLDEAAGLKRDADPMMIEVSQRPGLISGSWNRKRTDGEEEQSKQMRLVTAKSVLRPQMSFKDKIDNSSKPFIPTLKEKPNSKKPLSILVEHGEDGEEYFSHPYLFELNMWNPPKLQLQRQERIQAPDLEQTEYIFVDKVEQLQDMISVLKKEKEIAVDLEHHWYRSFQGIISLVQISTWQKDFVIDPFPLWSHMTALNEVFTNPDIVKVFHGADNDLIWLQRDFSVYVVNLFDTHQAAITLNFPRGSRKFDNILQHYCQVKTDKRFQLADWRIRPLPEEMLKYARKDTRFSIYIYREMKNELLAAGNERKNLLISTIDTCTDMCKRTYTKPSITESSHLEFLRKSRASFNSRQVFATKHIFQWRNKVAREEDESDQYVLPNHMLLKICTELPREMQGILACCNPIPPLVKQHLQSLHLIVLKGREQPLTLINQDVENPKMTSLAVAVDIAEDPLKSPLDLHIGDLDGPTVFDNPTPVLNYKRRPKTLSKPAISIFGILAGNDVDSKNGSDSSKAFLGPYKRYQMLMPYLKYLNREGNSEDKSHADQVRSIREHFDALTAMTPSEYTKDISEEAITAEFTIEEDEEDEQEISVIDSGIVRPLRGSKKSDKNLNKKRKRPQNYSVEKVGAKKMKDGDGDSSAQATENPNAVNYETEDFGQFSKKANAPMPDGVFDPWKGHNKHQKRGKQKQKFTGKSHSYKQ